MNQSFTYLVTLKGAAFLLKQHPQKAPYTLNFGTAPGSDIVSADGSIAAEAFAATTPDSNRKLQRDIERVVKTKAVKRYVFYYSPQLARSKENEHGVIVVRVKLSRAG